MSAQRSSRTSKPARKPATRKPSTPTAPPATPDDGFLTRKQAAAFTSVNLQIIDAAIRRSELKAYRIRGRDVKGKPSNPRRVVIRKLDLIAWLTANQV